MGRPGRERPGGSSPGCAAPLGRPKRSRPPRPEPRGASHGDSTRDIRGVGSLESAGPDELTFAEGERAAARAADSRAGCILVAPGVSLPGRTTLEVTHPKLAFIRATEALRPAVRQATGIHPTAMIALLATAAGAQDKAGAPPKAK